LGFCATECYCFVCISLFSKDTILVLKKLFLRQHCRELGLKTLKYFWGAGGPQVYGLVNSTRCTDEG